MLSVNLSSPDRWSSSGSSRTAKSSTEDEEVAASPEGCTTGRRRKCLSGRWPGGRTGDAKPRARQARSTTVFPTTADLPHPDGNAVPLSQGQQHVLASGMASVTPPTSHLPSYNICFSRDVHGLLSQHPTAGEQLGTLYSTLYSGGARNNPVRVCFLSTNTGWTVLPAGDTISNFTRTRVRRRLSLINIHQL